MFEKTLNIFNVRKIKGQSLNINIKDIDQETIVEALLELTQKGEHKGGAEDAFCDELKSVGFPDKIIDNIIEAVKETSEKSHDKRKFAENVYSSIIDENWIKTYGNKKDSVRFYGRLFW